MGNKSIFTSKTFYFALLYGLINVAGILGFNDFSPSSDVAEIVGIVVSIVAIALRFVTNRGVSLSGD